MKSYLGEKIKRMKQIFFPIVAKHQLCDQSYTTSVWKNLFIHLQFFKLKNQMIKFHMGKNMSELSIETQYCVTFLSMVFLFTKMIHILFLLIKEASKVIYNFVTLHWNIWKLVFLIIYFLLFSLFHELPFKDFIEFLNAAFLVVLG